MKKLVLILSTLLLISGICNSQDIEIFEKKGKYGLREGKKTLVKPKYENLQYVGDGLYAVKVKDAYGLMNKSGAIVVEPSYDEIKYMSDNTYQARIGNSWGLINRLNNIILPIEYSGFEPLTDYLYEAKYKENIGFISRYGDVVIPPLYQEIKEFGEYNYIVKQNGKYGIIDKAGKTLVPAEYDVFEKIPSTGGYDIRIGNKIGLMDSNFNILIPALYDSITESAVGKNLISGHKIGFYTEYGNKLVEPKYTSILFYQPEFKLAVVKSGDKYGFVTGYGAVVEPAYENISRFSDSGFAFVEKSGKLMAVAVDGRELTVQETMSSGPTPPPPGSR